MKDIEIKEAIKTSLSKFAEIPLASAATTLFNNLGYRSEKRLVLKSNSPSAFTAQFDKDDILNRKTALFSDWRSVDFVFQLTDDEIKTAVGGTDQLPFESKGKYNGAAMESYLFFAIDLAKSHYSRSDLSGITRAVNRLFPMPSMVLFRHGETLTLAVINRRLHKRDASKDVLKKVTLIKDIRFASPHRAHIEILADLAFDTLRSKHNVCNFVTLHAAWQKSLDSSELNKRFFTEIANWYFWALSHVEFPKDAPKQNGKDHISLIRLITRLMFVWFIKEKGLVPDQLFDIRHLPQILNGFLPSGPRNKESVFYRAILQNLFFATLNTEMEKRGWKREEQDLMAHSLYNHRELFQKPTSALGLFKDIPFLNGGLFECLDKDLGEAAKPRYVHIDGFASPEVTRPIVPDFLFFGEERAVDLSEEYNTGQFKKVTVRGLIHTLNHYKFTVAENTPIEEEIALDPELSGKVFENLLAAYNPETGATARKQTGSFYTPREIVDCMVDGVLKAHLTHALVSSGVMNEAGARAGLDILFTYTEKDHAFTAAEVACLIEAIDSLKAIDPAVGSGAFPMGLLHKLVYILGKLDKDNEKWKERQIARVRDTLIAAEKIDDNNVRSQTVQELEHQIESIKEAFARNELDYGRKLYLIENCIYGVDIQPIAVQIAKMRFFISLIVDQKIDDTKQNRGIRPLPNLETKFVAANSLVGISRAGSPLLPIRDIDSKEAELRLVRERHFRARTPKQKSKCRVDDARLRAEIAELLKNAGWPAPTAEKLAEWNPYDQNASADFFDAEWMFGITEGFDVVLGNPPYIGQKGHKEIFRSILPTSLGKRFHQGKMDLFYYFFHLALDILKNGGHCAYITTNYFITATYADKLRLDLKNRSAILRLINFNELKVFESAAGQHNAVTFLRKGVSANQVAETAFTSKTGSADEMILQAIISGEDADTQYRRVNQSELYEGNQHYIRMVSNEVSEIDPIMGILGKVVKCGTPLGEIAQANQGIVTGCDKVSPKHLGAYEIEAQKGDGIFVLTKDELKNLHLTPNEMRYIRPWFKNSDVKRWTSSFDADQYLVFADKRIGNLDESATISAHLNRFKKIITERSSNAPYLHRPRSVDFEGPKIVVPQRSYKNTFGYNEMPWYASADVYFITNPKPTVLLKFVLALLNSKLYFAWLYYKGKRKGEMMELYQKPLSEIPIKIIPIQEQKQFVTLVDKIIAAKQHNFDADTRAMEREIDQQVYALYGLTPKEITAVERSVK